MTKYNLIIKFMSQAKLNIHEAGHLDHLPVLYFVLYINIYYILS